jgi:dienelactone hydrolase
MLILFLLALSVAASAQSSRSHVGNFHPFLKAYAGKSTFPLSYLSRDWPDIEQWRKQGRATMRGLLAYESTPALRDAEILETVKQDGYTRRRVRYRVTVNRTTEAFLLIPDDLKGRAPAVVAIHDHGGFYYFGKEKIAKADIRSVPLAEHIQTSYGGRTYADELARRGFVVLVPDGFYFGSQRLDPNTVPESAAGELLQVKPGSDAYVRAYNAFASRHEEVVAKTIFAAGSTWPGILFQGDRASVDYLLTRAEVDADRIGCIGLSIGGFRSAHLFGLDGRIRAGVVAGWMTTYSSLLLDHLHFHTWMIYVPGQHAYLDLPDVVTLNAPNPLMVINCRRDILFTIDGMQAAERKIGKIYAKMDASDRFECSYYDEPHSLNVPAQDDAIAWLETWLK